MGSRSSTTDTHPVETVLVGSIRRPHGVGGEVVVEALTDVAGRFRPGSELLVSRAETGPASGTTIEGRVRVASSRRHRGNLLVRFEGFEDRDAVEGLRGAYLEIGRPPESGAPKGIYYYYQLLGCRCRDRRHGDLGEVVDLVEDGGGLLLIVEGEGRQLPVPFVESFLRQIDVAGRRIDLDLPPGLVETCRSRS